MELVAPDIGRPFDGAVTTLGALAVIEPLALVRRTVRIRCEGGRDRTKTKPSGPG
jgi:hypothetical protein